MQSLAFIREANLLIQELGALKTANETRSQQEAADAVADVQRRVNRLFSDLQNPSLLAAANLRNAATAAGLKLEQSLLAKIEQGEQMHLG